jgi:Helitron helicase-like domain at N-terminus
MQKTTRVIKAADAMSRDKLRQLINDDLAFQFLANVRGCPPYYSRAVKQLLAMVSQLGCPHFFLTLSAADMSWPELFKIIAEQANRFFVRRRYIFNMSYEEEASMLRTDPVLAAWHFDHQLKAFFRFILTHANCLGYMTTFFCRIEFQMWGSPHAHCLLWTSDGPDMSSATDDDILKFFTNKITGHLPAEQDSELHNPVNRLQRHSHLVACRNKKTGQYRFNFPKSPSDRTLFTSLPTSDEDLLAVLDR